MVRQNQHLIAGRKCGMGDDFGIRIGPALRQGQKLKLIIHFETGEHDLQGFNALGRISDGGLIISVDTEIVLTVDSDSTGEPGRFRIIKGDPMRFQARLAKRHHGSCKSAALSHVARAGQCCIQCHELAPVLVAGIVVVD